MCDTTTATNVTPLIIPLPRFTVSGTSECSACGRGVTLQLLIENGIIVDAGGTIESCEYCRECTAALIETVKGMSAYDAQAVTSEDFAPRMHAVIEKPGCDNWCVAALRIALRNFRLDIREAA